jgi:MFS superfamily sulfate permease-like transporter
MPQPSLIPGRGSSFFAYAREDIPAGIVVFLVALPLCLGVATASGAPPVAGMIAGIVGGLVVPLISRSALSVAGPAAGLTVLVSAAITELGYPSFLLCVVIAGIFQAAFGLLRLGLIAHFLPSSVIEGMLSAIGLLIILKQIPHAIGFDQDFEGDESFIEPDGHNTFNAIIDALGAVTPAAIVVAAFGFLLAIVWPSLEKRKKWVRHVPLPLAVVVGGVLAAQVSELAFGLGLSREHMVNLPPIAGPSSLGALVTFPEFSALSSGRLYYHAMTLALVASIETLLSLEAIDGLDPYRRISPTNRELVAQGVANACSGLIGGIPITSVIVRSSANAHAGGKTRLAALVHGLLLLIGLLALSTFLAQIPLAALAVVLILVGLKLNSIKLWKAMWTNGATQFVPFLATIVLILSTDLLRGTLIGAAVGLVFAIIEQQRNALLVTKDGNQYLITFLKDMTFLQKSAIKELLRSIPQGARVIISRRQSSFVDHDIQKLLSDFEIEAEAREISLTLTTTGAS